MKHDKEYRFMQILDLINSYAETIEELEGLKANIDIMIERMKEEEL